MQPKYASLGLALGTRHFSGAETRRLLELLWYRDSVDLPREFLWGAVVVVKNRSISITSESSAHLTGYMLGLLSVLLLG